MPKLIQQSHALILSSLLTISAIALHGCTTYTAEPEQPQSHIQQLQPIDDGTEVVRSGRYKLVEITPDEGQRHLLKQIIDVRIPRLTKDAPTVGFAMRYVLTDSGYTLCPGAQSTKALDNLPLPIVHSHIGPVRLHEALQMLAGPAWVLSVDDLTRQVCFDSVFADDFDSKEK